MSKIKRLLTAPFKPFKKLWNILSEKIATSIRLELILTFVICLLVAFISARIFANNYTVKHEVIDYSEGVSEIYRLANSITYKISTENISIKDSKAIKNIILPEDDDNYKVFITNLDGKILYKSQNVVETQIDVFTALKKATEIKFENQLYNSTPYISDNREYLNVYPVNFKDSKAYVIIKALPDGKIRYEETDAQSFFPALLGVITFILLFYIITNRKMHYIETIANGLLQISKGDLKYRINIFGNDELTSLANNINHMTGELDSKIQAERNAEKVKNELITNVSHDLRTPLTSIKGYLDLIKNHKYENDEQLNDYVNIAYNKSEKLSLLINDLFEYTKLSNNGTQLYCKVICIDELLDQLSDEFIPVFEENNISINKEFIDTHIFINADPNKIARAFDNLISNAIKYGKKPGEILIKLWLENDEVNIIIKNKCDEINAEDLNKLFDRFYRVEKSRSESTGGSGLGLAITKGIIELHHGSISVSYENKTETITFKIKLKTDKNIRN